MGVRILRANEPHEPGCRAQADLLSPSFGFGREVIRRTWIVLNLERKWLAAVPWPNLVSVNRDLCEKDEQPHAPKEPGYAAAQRLWEGAADRPMKLRAALDLCREIHHLSPFQFFNGNTVAAVVKLMVAEVLEPLPSVEAQMTRSTISHYVVGVIKANELEEVLRHIGRVWRKLERKGPSTPASSQV